MKDESLEHDIGNEKVQCIVWCTAVKNIGQCTKVWTSNLDSKSNRLLQFDKKS